jgi:adhesin transport system outer membrane protein
MVSRQLTHPNPSRWLGMALVGLGWLTTSANAQPVGTLLGLQDLVGTSVIAVDLDREVTAPLKEERSTQTLSSLIGQAMQKSPQLKQAQAQLEAAQARSGVSRAELLPSLSLRIAGGPEKSTGVDAPNGSHKHHYETASVRLTQPLFNLTQIKEFEGSRRSLQASELRVKAAQEAVAVNVTRAVVDLATARISLHFSEQQLKDLTQVMSFMEQRTQAGASSQADLERARSRVLAARQVRLDQQTQYRSAFIELERLTHRVPTALGLPSMAQLGNMPASLAQAKADVLENNPELQALRLEYQAQEKLVTAERSRYLPVLGLSLEQDHTRNARGDNPRWTDTRALLVMNWNVSLGGREYYGIQQAGAELINRESRLQEEMEKFEQVTDADITLLESSQLRKEAALSEVQAAQSVVDAVQAQLASGRINSLMDSLDASERLFASRQRLIQAIGQQLKAQAQLLQRTGQLTNLTLASGN